jgi:YhcH/YjgK/YiaL family protein
MIYDTLNNLPNYLGMSKNLDTAIEYIMARDITTLPLGRTKIDGDKVYVTVMEATPQASEKNLYETHQKYLDLQTDLNGCELFEVSLGEMKVSKPYDEATDAAFGSADTSVAGMLCEGRFALFLAGEAHKPTLKAAGCGKVKKAVFKIALDEDAQPDEEIETDDAE